MRDDPAAGGGSCPKRDDLESTVNLLKRIRTGDTRARDLLLERYWPVVRRLARGKVPTKARPLVDTDELVQLTMTAVFQHMDTFEHRHEGAFLAYLRKVLHNKILDIARRAHPEVAEMDGAIPYGGPSPIEDLIGKERLESYYRALDSLKEQARLAVMLRLELGYTFDQIAVAIECPTGNAARMLFGRALTRMAEHMSGHQEDLH